MRAPLAISKSFQKVFKNKTEMITVKPINSKKELRAFVRFRNTLYRGNAYAVPTNESAELRTLTPGVNPALDFCELQCFLARDHRGKIVGRIAAIINQNANEIWGNKQGRFGFVDFVEDIEVARALLQTAEKWVQERGMDSIHGPMGFTNMDKQGMLIEGFDQLGTLATIYNHPYYPVFMEQLGYSKGADWIEMLIEIPYPMPPRLEKFSRIVAQKSNLHVVRCRNNQEIIARGWGKKIFDLIDQEYSAIYGYNKMTERQKEYYTNMYIPLARPELMCMVANEREELVGIGISLPSMSRAMQRARGRKFPFGWWHLLRALRAKRCQGIDLMLIAVDKEYQNKGLTAIIMHEIISGMQSMGAVWAESNPELDDNTTMHSQWDTFQKVQHKRRRAFTRTF